jgi:ribosome maturation factor RimP
LPGLSENWREDGRFTFAPSLSRWMKGLQKWALPAFFLFVSRLCPNWRTMSQRILDVVEEFSRSLFLGTRLEFFDAQFRKEGHGWVLRLFIDHPEGVSLDHCEMVSRELSNFLDVEDLIGHPYHLEVSSPGMNRPLRNPAEFARFLGRWAKIKLHDAVAGQKVFIGEIVAVDDEAVDIKLDHGVLARCPHEQISKARLYL